MRYQQDPAQKKLIAELYDLRAQQAAAGKDSRLHSHINEQTDSVRQVLLNCEQQYIAAYVSAHPQQVAGVYMFYQLFNAWSTMPYSLFSQTFSRFQGGSEGVRLL